MTYAMPKRKAKRWAINLALVIIVLVGLAAILHPYLLSQVVTSSLKPPTKMLPKNQRHKATYDAGSVTSITPEDVAKAYKYKNTIDRVGQLVAPKIQLNMPIQPGVDYFTELLGAGEQYPRSEIAPGGVGNYVLASHHLESFWNTSGLFTRIDELALGDIIYVNDGQTVFTYTVRTSKQVSVSDTDWIAPQTQNTNSKHLTLYTCVSLATVNTLRYVVQSELTSETPISEDMPKTMVDAFNQASISMWTP